MRESDLTFFKNMLNERKAQIEKNIEDAHNEIKDLTDSHVSDDLDHAAVTIDKTIDSAISMQQRKELGEINFALSKIENGEYGVCEMCEEDISVPRLKVKPHAKYCISCREIIEKTKK